MDATGILWQRSQHTEGWYRPGDSQSHSPRDIALPAVVLRAPSAL